MGRAADVLLSDGTTVHLRPIQPEDADAVVAMHGRFSERTRYLRYFSPYPRIPARDLHRFVNVDHRDREALVVASGTDLVAVGRYERLGQAAADAEVAFVVQDAYQGRGVGSILLEHLAAAAREAGVERFVAEVLPSNSKMVNVFTDAGYEVSRRYADGVVHLTFPVAQTGRSLAVQWEREHRTEARSVARLMRPASVAVYGASRSGGGVGAAVLSHLRASGFAGEIHAGRSLAAPVDLAVVAVPPDAIAEVVADAAAAGVHGLLVVTELDPRQRRELVQAALGAGMRVVGPGSLGLADSWVPVNATLLPRLPGPGRVALFSQSGPLGLQLLAEADRRGVGVSGFVSVGRRADVSGNDLLQFWADDPQTDVVAMYLETFGNPRKFSRIARTVGRRKPIVILAGETGLIGSTLDSAAMEALRMRSGVVEVGTVAELFDVVAVLGSQPLAAGDRIGVVSNAFALGALAAARARKAGLRIGRVGSVGPTASPQELVAAVRSTLDSDDADALVVVVAPPLPTGAMTHTRELFAPFAEALGQVGRGADKPIVTVFLAGDGPEGVPTFRSVEEAIRALTFAVRRAAWLREPPGELPEAGPAPVQRSVDALLEHYRVPVEASATVIGTEQAVAAARELGFPVALKVARHPHRIDIGAVRLNVADEGHVRRAYADLRRLFGDDVEVVVQGMAAPGVACVIEALDDPAFGPVVGFGLGGPVTELVGDRAWRAAPLTDRDAWSLVRAPKAAPLLEGMDLESLADLLVQVGQMADQVPELRRLVLNPVLVHESGWSVLHAGGSLDSPATRPDTGPRML